MTKSLCFLAQKPLQKCAIICLALPILVSMSPAALAGWCDLHIRNNSRYKIQGIYMSHAGKDHWSGNLLEHEDKHEEDRHFDRDHQRGDRLHSYYDEDRYVTQEEHYIAQGHAISMRYEYDDGQCHYDMKVVSEHEPRGEIHRVNLCKTTAYEISDDEYGGPSRAW